MKTVLENLEDEIKDLQIRENNSEGLFLGSLVTGLGSIIVAALSATGSPDIFLTPEGNFNYSGAIALGIGALSMGYAIFIGDASKDYARKREELESSYSLLKNAQ